MLPAFVSFEFVRRRDFIFCILGIDCFLSMSTSPRALAQLDIFAALS